MMKKKYTIRDIAEIAGVSKGTVDRVIHKRGKVSQNKLEKVTKLLKEIDYQPNIIARSLKRSKNYIISIVLPDPKMDTYWLPCVEGIDEAIKEFAFFGVEIRTYLFDPLSTSSFLQINDEVLKLKPDAVLLSPLFINETKEVIKKYNLNKTIISTFNDPLKLDGSANFVGQDLIKSGRIAAKLMEVLVPDNSELFVLHIDEDYNNAIHMQQKEEGFMTYFKNETKKKINIKTFNYKELELERNLKLLLNKSIGVSGIFISNSRAYKVAQLINNVSNKNIKLIGYDLLEENIKFLKSGVIDFLIHQNPKQQVYIGISLLVEHLLFDRDILKQKLLPIDIINSENFDSYLG